MVTSFAAVPDVAQWAAHDSLSSYGTGVVTSYSHTSGHLFAAGQSSRVRLWDVRAESCVSSWASTGPDTFARDKTSASRGVACVTSLCSAGAGYQHSDAIGSRQDGGLGGDAEHSTNLEAAVVLAGFSDGALRLFDARLPPDRSCVALWRHHDCWIVSAHLSLSSNAAISASVNGVVGFFDLRGNTTVRALDVLASSHSGAETSTSMSAFAVHPAAPIFAVGSHAQFVKVLTREGYVLKWMKHHDGFLGQRIGK
jgi:regulatory associated protein of mTOR